MFLKEFASGGYHKYQKGRHIGKTKQKPFSLFAILSLIQEFDGWAIVSRNIIILV